MSNNARQPGVRSRNRMFRKLKFPSIKYCLNQKSNFGSVEDNLGKYLSSQVGSYVPGFISGLLKPKEGGITLHQIKIFLRCATRFFQCVGCFPRVGKTWENCRPCMLLLSDTPTSNYL